MGWYNSSSVQTENVEDSELEVGMGGLWGGSRGTRCFISLILVVFKGERSLRTTVSRDLGKLDV
jgi:hypothetical protein